MHSATSLNILQWALLHPMQVPLNDMMGVQLQPEVWVRVLIDTKNKKVGCTVGAAHKP